LELFITSFSQVPDPRASNARHALVEILFIAFVAVLCGAKSCVEMADFGRAKLAFFKQMLDLEHGIPSHDTFSTVFRMLDPKAFEASFRRFMAAFGASLAKPAGPYDVIAIDGKALKRAYDAGKAHAPRMMVSAFAAEMRMTLSCLAAENGDEVSAALELLGLIDLKGKIVTADALHCHRRMAEGVIARGGDYCLALKGNQDSLQSDAGACFLTMKKTCPAAATTERSRGRIETRRAVVVAAGDLGDYHQFPGLKAFGRIESARRAAGKTQSEVRLFALSRKLAPAQLLRVARAHWAIENALHWELDVVVGEDAARNRRDHGPQNLAVLRRLALNVARADQTKGSLAGKLRQAGWNDQCLLNLLSQTR
jgi:predicted transposase YbfD/YdcC